MLEKRSEEVYEVKVCPAEINGFADARIHAIPSRLNRTHIHYLIVNIARV